MDIFMDWGSKGFLSCEGMMIDSLFVGIPIWKKNTRGKT